MKPLDELRRLPLVREPPHGVRERARERLLASLATPCALAPQATDLPRPNASASVLQLTGAKLALVALGSGLAGAGLVVGAQAFAALTQEAEPSLQSLLEPSGSVAGPALSTDSSNEGSEGASLAQGTALSVSGAGSPSSSQPRLVTKTRTVTSLAAERELLDSVRAQISGGHFLRAFELTEAHLKRFPAGKLAEEREVMAIMALAKMGERERANLRAERFQQDYPRSFFTQVIEAALGGSP